MSATSFIPTTGFFFREFNYTDAANQVGAAQIMSLGGGSWGPINTPVRQRTPAELFNTFGPTRTDDYGIASAAVQLRGGNQFSYMRIATSSARQAAIGVPGVTGGSPAVKATGTLTFSNSALPADGDVVVIDDGPTTVTFEFDSNGAITTVGGIAVAIDANTSLPMATRVANTVQNLLAAINYRNSQITPSAFTVKASLTSTYVIGLVNTTAGTAGNASITTTSSPITVAGMAGGAAAVTGVSNASVLTIKGRYTGSYGNYIRVVAQATTTPNAPANRFDLLVYAPDMTNLSGTKTLREAFRNLSMDPLSDRYVQKVVQNGTPTVSSSDYIAVLPAAGTGSATTVTAGTYDLGSSGVPGDDGVAGLAASDYIGVLTPVPTGLQALRNPEAVYFNILNIPGVSNATVIDAAKTLVTKRGDAVFIVDPPLGLDLEGSVNWHNGLDVVTPNAPTAPLDSSFMGVYGPWVDDVDPLTGNAVKLPPSGYFAEAATKSFAGPGQQFAVAGYVRGKISGLGVEWSASPEDRGTLMNDYNRFNPICRYLNDGYFLMGNKTLYRSDNSAVADMSIRMAILDMRMLLTAVLKNLVFDPADEATWRAFERESNTVLEAYQSKRGIAGFQVFCNESTNTAAVRKARRVRGIFIVRPTYAAEAIVGDFGLFDQGIEFNDALRVIANL